jgi:hypothetical protein
MLAMHFIINLRRGDRDQLISPLKGATRSKTNVDHGGLCSYCRDQ